MVVIIVVYSIQSGVDVIFKKESHPFSKHTVIEIFPKGT